MLIKYFAAQYNDKPFELFGTTHIITLAILLIFNFTVILFFRKWKYERFKTRFRYGLAAFIIFVFVFQQIWSICSGFWSVTHSLPLHICDVAVIFSAIILINKNYFLYEILYFWGLAGSVQALLTPDIAPYNFPHFIYISFFVLHGIVITVILYMTIIEKYRPNMKSIWKTFIFTNIYAVIIVFVNILSGGNYLFLCAKPQNPSIIDFLGSWPWYIASLELTALISFFVSYIPFTVRNIVLKKHINNNTGFTH